MFKIKSDIIERIRPKTFFLGVLSLLATLFLLVTLFIYSFPSLRISQKITRVIPYPLAGIGLGHMVTTRALGENMDSIKKFYESQDFAKVGLRIDFSTTEGQQRLKIREKDLLNKMLEDRAIEKISQSQGILITPAEAQAGIQAKVKELGTTGQVEESLARLYGWSLSDFGEKVVLPSLYEAKLVEKFNASDNGQAQAKQKITQAVQALKKGQDFTAVAKTYSEGQTASNGGELGWFALEDLAPTLQKPVDMARPGTPTDIVESDLGYHILLLEESKLENGKRLYHLKQIFTRKPSFADWLSGEMRKMPIFVLSRDYKWNVDEAEIEFRSQTLQEAEKKLREKAAGDPSLLL